MARAVFFGLPAHGHTNPTLPLVRELVSRGEEVVYYTTEELEERVRRTGAEVRRYDCPFLRDFAGVTERLEQLLYGLMRATRDVLDAELPRLRAERPAYVVSDSIAPWGPCAAEALGLPAVLSVPTFAFNRKVMLLGARVAEKRLSAIPAKLRFMAKAARIRRGIRKTYGTTGPALASPHQHRAGLKVVYTSRFFQPFAESFDETYRFVGPSISDRADAADLSWLDAGRGPILYVSMGTLFNDRADFYRACFEAFGGTDLRVVLSTGSRVRVDGAPPNFLVREYVPQLDVLRRASAFVTHGGMNSVSESIYYGVPVVAVPQMSEQAIVAERARALGAGLTLRNDRATAAALRDSVRRVLDDESFARGAREIGESLRSAGGFERAGDEVLAFTRSAR
jgi:MGT family glycosyltransferase